MEAKEVFSTLIKNEIDISFEIAQHWNSYQTLSVKKGYEKVSKTQFLDCVKLELNKSLFIQEDRYLEWLEGQFEITLPNDSSGSTMTALLDLDGIFSQFGDAIWEINNEVWGELYNEMLDYQRTLLGKLRVEKGISLQY